VSLHFIASAGPLWALPGRVVWGKVGEGWRSAESSFTNSIVHVSNVNICFAISNKFAGSQRLRIFKAAKNGILSSLVGAGAPNWYAPPFPFLLMFFCTDSPSLTDPPDSIPIHDFMRLEKYGRRTFSTSRNPFTCGLTGRTFSYEQFFQRADNLAKSLSRRTGWTPNEETPWDKVLGIFSLNTVGENPSLVDRLTV